MSVGDGSFTELYLATRDTSRVDEKVELLTEYLKHAPSSEFGWAVYLLQGGSFRAGVKTRQLREWASEFAGLPLWLFEESYAVTGDLAETVSLVVSSKAAVSNKERREKQSAARSLASWIVSIQEINAASSVNRRELVLARWLEMTQPEILVFTKLLTGGLRIGVAKGLVAKALAKVTNLPQAEVWQRLAGEWRPDELTRDVLSAPSQGDKSRTPYPFFLAYPLEAATLKDLQSNAGQNQWRGEWQCEWKWDGIRAQIVKRAGQMALWSRGDELISESFPELCLDAMKIPDSTVLDGEVVAWDQNGYPANFSDLQKRLNRKKLTTLILQSTPVRFLVYDLLEYQGEDLRPRPLRERRQLLEDLAHKSFKDTACFVLPGLIDAASWSVVSELQQSARTHHAEGLMLKRLDSPYGVGRTNRGAWWKWKVEPLSVDAVLLYAQKGHGRRADLFTDYTFAVWDGDNLVTFAKAYSGLSDREIVEVDAFIKRNTQERFGPVRTVAPELVFEIAFEDIWPSKRHRSGVAVRFPRIARWRRDKPAREADSIESLRGLLKPKKSS